MINRPHRDRPPVGCRAQSARAATFDSFVRAYPYRPMCVVHALLTVHVEWQIFLAPTGAPVYTCRFGGATT